MHGLPRVYPSVAGHSAFGGFYLWAVADGAAVNVGVLTLSFADALLKVLFLGCLGGSVS